MSNISRTRAALCALAVVAALFFAATGAAQSGVEHLGSREAFAAASRGEVAPDQVVGMGPKGPFGRRRRKAQSSVDVDDHDHVRGVLDQRGVACLDDPDRPALPQQRVVARKDGLAKHDEQRQHEDDDCHRIARAGG